MSHGRKGVWLLSLLLAFNILPGRALALAPGDLLKPVGRAVAIELDTEGVIVAGLAQVETETGERSPAGEAGLRTGDRITAVNGRNVHTGEEFLDAVEALGEEDVLLTACRDGKEETFTVEPVRGQDGGRYLGLWLRSSISGIGTVTFQDPESGYFGALGHGVCLEGDNSLMPISGGAIAPASVSDVARGERGYPGALVGVPEGGETLGSVEKNTDHGIFGVARPLETGEPPCGGDALPAAGEGEIKKGQATILSNVEGCAVEEYTVEITQILPSAPDGRQLALKVTDERLMEKAGGIVQGMSGSPIIQNGKLVGAVTHVLVEDPERGYGVSIEEMLAAAG